MLAPTLFPPGSPSFLAEATEGCVAFLISQGHASKPTPELRREVELHLWLDLLCDFAPAAREARDRNAPRSTPAR